MIRWSAAPWLPHRTTGARVCVNSAGRNDSVVQSAHPARAPAVVLEEVLARGVVEAFGEPCGHGAGQLDGVGRSRAEQAQRDRDPPEKAIVLGQRVAIA